MAILEVAPPNIPLKDSTKSSLTAASKGSTSSREYAVGLDANGDLAVNVPWLEITKSRIDSALSVPSDSTKFYRGDGTWAAPSINGGLSWYTLYTSSLGKLVSSTYSEYALILSISSWSTYNLLGFYFARPIYYHSNSMSYTGEMALFPAPLLTLTEKDLDDDRWSSTPYYPFSKYLAAYGSTNWPMKLSIFSSGWNYIKITYSSVSGYVASIQMPYLMYVFGLK